MSWGLAEGRQRYALFTNDQGGILDDLMFSNLGDHLFLVVNAACKDADIAHLKAHLSDSCDIIVRGRPRAARIAGTICRKGHRRSSAPRRPPCASWMCAQSTCMISTASSRAPAIPAKTAMKSRCQPTRLNDLARMLLEHPDVQPIGLGARDSLRLEAGLCLYGNDIDTTTTPAEAALGWAIQKARRSGGARAGGFPGAEHHPCRLENGAERRRVGLKPEGKAPVRAHAELFADDAGQTKIGEVTSGGFGPSVDGPVAMGYVDNAHATDGTTLFAEVRGKYLPVTVIRPSFRQHPVYKR